jgi:hypothetical protein
MICDKGTTDFKSTKQIDILKQNLSAKYKLTDIKDYGSCVVLRNFQKTILAQIFIEGKTLRYEVEDSTAYFQRL